MLKAQLPIEEKVGYADYVIHNEHSLDETWTAGGGAVEETKISRNRGKE